jgi:nitrogen regulatory protein PII
VKILTLIVYADVKQVLADTLHGLQQVRGFTFTNVEGHGEQDGGGDAALSARDDVVGYVPHVRVDIVLADEDVADVLASLRNSRCGLAGRGRYWITEVESQGQL